MKNNTPRVMLRRALTLLLLGTAILVQSCSKESDSIAPQPTMESADQPKGELFGRSAYILTNGNLPIDPMSGPLGGQVEVIWPDYYYSGGQSATPTARVELTGPAHIIIPHVYLISYFGNTTTNGFTFTIPPYIPTGSYTFHVTADQPNASLVRQPGYTDAEGTLTVTQASVTGLSNLTTDGAIIAGPNPFVFNERGFVVSWPSYQYPTNSKVRFSMRNTNGVYYLLARPNLLGITNNYPVGPTIYGMDNIFTVENAGGVISDGVQVHYSTSDVPSGTYTMYLDNYSTTYTSSATSSNGSTITLP